MFGRKQRQPEEAASQENPSQKSARAAEASAEGWYHIDAQTGDVQACVKQRGFWHCPFGEDDTHFTNADEARDAFKAKQEEFQAWTARSAIPQEAGWFTEHVYDPSNRERYYAPNFDRWPYGTRIVVENGWILEKQPFVPGEDDVTLENWILIHGQDENKFKIDGREFTGFHVEEALKEFGGRVEARNGIQPYALMWKTREKLHAEYDRDYGEIERQFIAERDAEINGSNVE